MILCAVSLGCRSVDLVHSVSSVSPFVWPACEPVFPERKDSNRPEAMEDILEDTSFFPRITGARISSRFPSPDRSCMAAFFVPLSALR